MTTNNINFNNTNFPTEENLNPLKRKASEEGAEAQNKVSKIATETITSSNTTGNQKAANQTTLQAERITNEFIKRNPAILKNQKKSELENDIKATLDFINRNKSIQKGYIKSKSDSPFPVLFQGTKAFFTPSTNTSPTRGNKFKTFNIGIEIDNESEEFIAFLIIHKAKDFNTARVLGSLNIANRQNVMSDPKFEYHLQEKNMIIQIQELFDGDIHNLAQKENWDFLKKIKIMQEAAKGISELHSHGYIHRDIKPDQFFKKGEKIVLADLDTVIEAKNASDPKYCSANLAGTMGFIPRDGFLTGPSEAVDMFAFGKSLEMFFNDIQEKKEKTVVEEKLLKLIEALTNEEPKNRPNAFSTMESLVTIAGSIPSD